MQSVFVIITKLIASKNYFCKKFFCNSFGRVGRVFEGETGGVIFVFFFFLSIFARKICLRFVTKTFAPHSSH